MYKKEKKIPKQYQLKITNFIHTIINFDEKYKMSSLSHQILIVTNGNTIDNNKRQNLFKRSTYENFEIPFTNRENYDKEHETKPND